MQDGDKQKMDPYQSPAMDAIVLEERTRPLTRAERAALVLYFEHRERPFIMGPLIWRMVPNWCLIMVMMTAAVILVYGIFPANVQTPHLVLVGLCGCLAGVVFRDLGVARRLIMLWPVLRDVFDWAKLESMLESQN